MRLCGPESQSSLLSYWAGSFTSRDAEGARQWHAFKTNGLLGLSYGDASTRSLVCPEELARSVRGLGHCHRSLRLGLFDAPLQRGFDYPRFGFRCRHYDFCCFLCGSTDCRGEEKRAKPVAVRVFRVGGVDRRLLARTL